MEGTKLFFPNSLMMFPISENLFLNLFSADGGASVKTDPKAETMMAAIGKKLNLQPHIIQDVTMAGPADLEIHSGKVIYLFSEISR